MAKEILFTPTASGDVSDPITGKGFTFVLGGTQIGSTNIQILNPANSTYQNLGSAYTSATVADIGPYEAPVTLRMILPTFTAGDNNAAALLVDEDTV